MHFICYLKVKTDVLLVNFLIKFFQLAKRVYGQSDLRDRKNYGLNWLKS